MCWPWKNWAFLETFGDHSRCFLFSPRFLKGKFSSKKWRFLGFSRKITGFFIPKQQKTRKQRENHLDLRFLSATRLEEMADLREELRNFQEAMKDAKEKYSEMKQVRMFFFFFKSIFV